jgi:hypothetical protein
MTTSTRRAPLAFTIVLGLAVLLPAEGFAATPDRTAFAGARVRCSKQVCPPGKIVNPPPALGWFPLIQPYKIRPDQVVLQLGIGF